jgi:hypothetical protein
MVDLQWSKFWEQVHRTEGCWLWVGPMDDYGVGHLLVLGRRVAAHRLSWVLANGPIPDGMCVGWRCGNPSCVRPDHLRLYRRGLSDDTRARIVAMSAVWDSGYIARVLGISQRTVSRVLHGR